MARGGQSGSPRLPASNPTPQPLLRFRSSIAHRVLDVTYLLSGREGPREAPVFGQCHTASGLWSQDRNLSQVLSCLVLGSALSRGKGDKKASSYDPGLWGKQHTFPGSMNSLAIQRERSMIDPPGDL